MIFVIHLKANMELPINDQLQLRHYLAPFSHNTFETYRQTDRRTGDNGTIDAYNIVVARQKIELKFISKYLTRNNYHQIFRISFFGAMETEIKIETLLLTSEQMGLEEWPIRGTHLTEWRTQNGAEFF